MNNQDITLATRIKRSTQHIRKVTRVFNHTVENKVKTVKRQGSHSIRQVQRQPNHSKINTIIVRFTIISNLIVSQEETEQKPTQQKRNNKKDFEPLEINVIGSIRRVRRHRH